MGRGSPGRGGGCFPSTSKTHLKLAALFTHGLQCAKYLEHVCFPEQVKQIPIILFTLFIHSARCIFLERQR